MKRTAIPGPVRELVMKEYFHECALCAGKQPQLHHIDGDPSNNDVQNLIPLCPNHHLRDQHNPTSPFDPDLLSLFRRFKDPAVLSSQFQPLYKRMRFLMPSANMNSDADTLCDAWCDLVNFVSSLNMGKYYSERLEQLFRDLFSMSAVELFASSVTRVKSERNYFFEELELFPNCRQEIEELLVELVRYQGWEYTPS